MSYQVTELSVAHNGNNSTTEFYVIPFEFDLTGGAHPIRVFLDGVEFFDFEVSTQGVRTIEPIANTSVLFFCRDTPFVQPRTFPNEELPRPEELEGALNRLTRQDQELAKTLERATLLPPGMEPSEVTNTTAGRDEDGNPINRTPEEEVEFLGILGAFDSAQQAASSAATSAQQAANSATATAQEVEDREAEINTTAEEAQASAAQAAQAAETAASETREALTEAVNQSIEELESRGISGYYNPADGFFYAPQGPTGPGTGRVPLLPIADSIPPWATFNELGYALDGFSVPGVTPSDAFLRHIKMPHPQEVWIDFPENIAASGLSMDEVWDAAVLMMDGTMTRERLRGDFDTPGNILSKRINGAVRLSYGTYNFERPIFRPGRMNVHGNRTRGRADQTGTILRFLDAPELQNPDALNPVYCFNSVAANTTGNDVGNFDENLSYLSIRGNGKARGAIVRGAQVTSIEHFYVVDSADVSLWVEGARPVQIDHLDLGRMRYNHGAPDAGNQGDPIPQAFGLVVNDGSVKVSNFSCPFLRTLSNEADPRMGSAINLLSNTRFVGDNIFCEFPNGEVVRARVAFGNAGQVLKNESGSCVIRGLSIVNPVGTNGRLFHTGTTLVDIQGGIRNFDLLPGGSAFWRDLDNQDAAAGAIGAIVDKTVPVSETPNYSNFHLYRTPNRIN